MWTGRHGSSPRVRGKRRQTRPSAVSIRIIPARAGQTEWLRSRIGKYADHPRACGANYMASLSWKVGVGSSPRVRGKRSGKKVGFEPIRIIPARAGQTSTTPDSRGRTPDHPRACGANGGVGSSDIVQCGSSPRVRGKPDVVTLMPVCQRIIPARAGQTHASNQCGLGDTDHPRACGANAAKLALPPFPSGSSPRVRGKRNGCGRESANTRIIPARAGQTTWQA